MKDDLQKALLDASVLFPLFVRDVLLRAADLGFYRVYWTEEILEEVARNLVKNSKMDIEGTKRLLETLSRLFPDSIVTGHEFLIGSMLNQKKDRHVAAAAVKAGADVIVTSNLKDFRQLPGNIKAMSPDDFLCDLFKGKPDDAVQFMREVAAAKNNPPLDLPALLHIIEKPLPNFAKTVARRARIDLS